MLKSIQWKLVIISFLLVWLAMSIVGVYITQAIKNEQIESATTDIVARINYLADNIKDKMQGAPNIDDIVNNWFLGQGKQVIVVNVISSAGYTVAQKNQDENDSSMNSYMIEKTTDAAMRDRKPKVLDNEFGNKLSKSIAVPIIASNNKDVVGVIYVKADLYNIEENMKGIKGIMTNATIWALCITVLFGSLLARTITGPIKEVTSKAERLAKGDFGQVISVKSNDEVGQLTEMFNYLTVRLKSSLDEVYREKNKIETILTHMTDGIIAVDEKGQILHANPATFKIFDIREEDVRERTFDEIACAVDLGISCDELFNENEKNNILSINNLIIKINVVQFKNEKNETAGAIIVLQDVTEQERLDKMRKEFVANVSHELRTPITTIKSYTETLLDGALDSREYAVNFLKVIDGECDRMTRLVKDLLQLSKLDYDKMQWNMKKINVADIANDCVYRMAISAKQKNQELTFEKLDDIPEIIGDKDRIDQVLVNIISNAIKYTPDNGKIEVQLGREGQYAAIRVKDNGMGIPEEDLPRLFERFYRVDKARSRVLGGTGLGLSIAKQIVEAHKGLIKINSEYGKGTEVIIKLPCEI